VRIAVKDDVLKAPALAADVDLAVEAFVEPALLAAQGAVLDGALEHVLAALAMQHRRLRELAFLLPREKAVEVVGRLSGR